MRAYLLLAAGLALASCATHQQLTAPPAPAEPLAQADSTAHPPAGIVVQPARTALDKLTGRTPAAAYYPPGTPVVAGKKSTFIINQVAGNQTTNATTAAKNATIAAGDHASAKQGDTKATGGAVLGQDGSVTNALTGGGDLAAATGQDSQVTQTVPPAKPKLTAWQQVQAGLAGVWSAVKWPLAVVLGVFAVGAAICALAPASGVGLWLLGLLKRKKSTLTPTSNA